MFAIVLVDHDFVDYFARLVNEDDDHRHDRFYFGGAAVRFGVQIHVEERTPETRKKRRHEKSDTKNQTQKPNTKTKYNANTNTTQRNTTQHKHQTQHNTNNKHNTNNQNRNPKQTSK